MELRKDDNMRLFLLFINPNVYAGKCPVCNEPVFVQDMQIKVHYIRINGIDYRCSGSERVVTDNGRD